MKAVRQFVSWSGSLTAVLLLSAYPPDRLAAQDYRAQALRILKTVPLIDGHNDIPDAVRGRGGVPSEGLSSPLRTGASGRPPRRYSGRWGRLQAVLPPAPTAPS